jgi:hypothetical protein
MGMKKCMFSGVVLLALASLALACAVFAFPANAAIIPFSNITNNGPLDIYDQFFVDVTGTVDGKASFRFFNTGPISSSITDIYFDSYKDGPLEGLAGIINGSGMANGVNPGEEITILFTLFDSMSINVQSIGASGYSDSFIHAAEPGTMLLLGSGLIGLAGWGRKKFRK